MGKIIKNRIEYGGSSNSAENIKYDDTKNVKTAIDEVKSEIATTNSNLPLPLTQAEYDALSEEEKKNGRLYIIVEETV